MTLFEAERFLFLSTLFPLFLQHFAGQLPSLPNENWACLTGCRAGHPLGCPALNYCRTTCSKSRSRKANPALLPSGPASAAETQFFAELIKKTVRKLQVQVEHIREKFLI
ncbi:MAG: hypothetical protein LUF81_05530, partial [Clostridiales bacterium]|nr:hypothetical protein [Clostridiales bacterium]